MAEEKVSVKVKVRTANLLKDNEVQRLIDEQCKLLTSKQLAHVIGLKSDAALRKHYARYQNQTIRSGSD